MGQQQLLLVVLSAIIVGISIVIGIQMFKESAVQANQDAVMQDVMNIASRSREWFRKPAIMGGGDQSFAAITLAKLNVDSTNANGTYALSAITPVNFTVTGTGVEGTPLTIAVNVYKDSIGTPTVTP